MTLRNAANDASVQIQTESTDVVPIRPRTITARRSTITPLREDLTVQIQIMGGKDVSRWHRKMVGGYKTACGLDLTLPENKQMGHRIESYLDRICEDCHTDGEIEESAKLNAARAANRGY